MFEAIKSYKRRYSNLPNEGWMGTLVESNRGASSFDCEFQAGGIPPRKFRLQSTLHMGEAFPVRLKTLGFSAEGWVGTFYPEKTQPSDYLRLYSERLDTVEVDSTFYRIPAESTVENWYEQTPEGFIFAAKVPQAVTHEKCMEDCDEDMQRFLQAMSCLRKKRGPLLQQFPYYRRRSGMTPVDFAGRLGRFLPKLPRDWQLALKLRNKNRLGPRLLDALWKYGVALAIIDHPWMPRPSQMLEPEVTTANLGYARLLGDRYEIEEITKKWDKTVI